MFCSFRVNRVVRTIVTAIHDKILIPRRLACHRFYLESGEREEKQNRFLKYYSPSSVLLFHARRELARYSIPPREFSPDTTRFCAFLSLFFFPFFRLFYPLFLLFFLRDEFVPIDADRIGRIMLLRRSETRYFVSRLRQAL